MIVIKPSVSVIDLLDGSAILKKIEAAGRTCYKSEANITDESAERFVRNIIKRGHESVLEHEKISVRIICDRGVTHELVRHRIASYSQESTRYVNYKLSGMEFIKPIFWEVDEDIEKFALWLASMERAEEDYNALIDMGASPQQARSILPNSLKTEVVATMNIRSWRNFFKLRCAPDAHPQMREIAFMILKELKVIPVVFDDIEQYGWDE